MFPRRKNVSQHHARGPTASKHASRTLISISDSDDSLHITSLSHLMMFVRIVATTTRCCRKLDDGHLCGGTYEIWKFVPKGIGGALQAQAICSGCGFIINYGDPKFSLSSSRPTQMSIGRELMISVILLGRPLHTHYKNTFGVIGMDTYSSPTFQRMMGKIADALEEELHHQVSARSPSSIVHVFTESYTHIDCSGKEIHAGTTG